jgi:hypothetical protein
MGRAVRDAQLTYEAETQAIREQYSSRGNNLVPAGVAAMEQAAARRDAALARIQVVAEQQGDRLLASFPHAPVPFLPADLAPTAQFTVTSADSTLPADTLTEGAALLSQATDPATPREARFKANLLLHHAYSRVLRRYGGKPPKHWDGVWASLAVELADLSEQHIDTVWERAQHRLAVEAVEGFRTGLQFLISMARQHGRWDDVYILGAQSFPWPAPPPGQIDWSAISRPVA